MSKKGLLLISMTSSLLLLIGCSLAPPVESATSASYSATNSVPPAKSAEASPQHRAVVIAERMVGVPYRYGGTTPKGFDCSGLVYYSYSHAGYRIARDSRGQYAQTLDIDPRDLRPGDLLFFNIDGKNGHVAIYVGNDRFIHSPSSGKRVSYASLKEEYWREHFVKAGRLR